jgi:biopolymer transport protein ExbB
MQEQSVGLAHFWAQSDGVIHAVAVLLLLMSIASWYFILAKTYAAWQMRRVRRDALENFWQAPTFETATTALKAQDQTGLFTALALAAQQAAIPVQGSLGAQADQSELITRALRQAINRGAAQLESGLTLLASVGSTAPFVGLFGTVWSIYHALVSIAAAGQVQIDRVAGPVGEALIMTAIGLAVAIPAVLAYNAFTRLNRLLLAEMDGFAHDLHATLTVGGRPAQSRN